MPSVTNTSELLALLRRHYIKPGLDLFERIGKAALALGSLEDALKRIAGRHNSTASVRRFLDEYDAKLAEFLAPAKAVCAWCPTAAGGTAEHNDGTRHPSCGNTGHGMNWEVSE